MRGKAYDSGNLKTTEQQVVTQQPDKIIVIEQADPEVVYVPSYSPTVVYGALVLPELLLSRRCMPRPDRLRPDDFRRRHGRRCGDLGRLRLGRGWGHGDVDIDVNNYNNFNRNTNVNCADTTRSMRTAAATGATGSTIPRIARA